MPDQYMPCVSQATQNNPIICQPTFNWKAVDKYWEICNFEVEVKNIFMPYMYNTQDSKSPNNIKLARLEGLRLVQTLNDGEQEMCRKSMGSFEVLSDKFMSQPIIITIFQTNQRVEWKCWKIVGLPQK